MNNSENNRLEHINKFYNLLYKLEKAQTKRFLKNASGRMKWPEKGIYFFFEQGEFRENGSPRVVRIGTHAVSKGSKTKYWTRLRQHKGNHNGGGNHRSSVFRKLVGQSLINKFKLNYPDWENKKLLNRKLVITNEKPLEIDVSKIIGNMPFLSLQVLGESSKDNLRKFIETNSIALLSNRISNKKLDMPSTNWLGFHSGHSDVISSGLWNSNDTEKEYNPEFLDRLEEQIKNTIERV